MNSTKTFWEKIYRENSSKIKGVCRRYVYDNQEAEDLMHEVFLTAINKSESYSGKGSIEGWIRRIAINTALMHLRKKHTGIIFTDSQQINFAQMENTEIENTRRQIIESADFSADELLRIIGFLPEHHRLVFNMYVIDKYSHAQISKELDISEGTSKSHLARARKKIQEMLYHEAVDKQNQKARKKGFILLLFARHSKANYIDWLIQSKLSNYSIPVFSDFESMVQGINMNNLVIPAIRSTITRIVLYASTVLVISLVSIRIVSYQKPMEQLTPAPLVDTNKNDSNFVKRIDSDSIQVVEDNSNSSRDTIQTSKPVVVKRKIIQRKTVVIKDTVKVFNKNKQYKIKSILKDE
jgi:RNA polymerase sigma factor (sigma-70 family)